MRGVTLMAPNQRWALARCRVEMRAETAEQVAKNAIAKGDVLAAARIAGIQGAKRAAEMLPGCRLVALDATSVNFSIGERSIEVEVDVRAQDRTGVEMEAMMACAAAALTIYDMCKALDRTMSIEQLSLWERADGHSGSWRRSPGEPSAP
ncbi:MAG: cyclic pyranopterin monophosphate synthase MoaC [Actinomycetes bacterium]